MKKYLLLVCLFCTFFNGLAGLRETENPDTIYFAANVDSILIYLALSPQRNLEVNITNFTNDVILIDTVHFVKGVRKNGGTIVSYFADNNPALINAHLELNLILINSGDSVKFSLNLMDAKDATNAKDLTNSQNIDFTLFYIRMDNLAHNKDPNIYRFKPNNINYNHFIELHNY